MICDHKRITSLDPQSYQERNRPKFAFYSIHRIHSRFASRQKYSVVMTTGISLLSVDFYDFINLIANAFSAGRPTFDAVRTFFLFSMFTECRSYLNNSRHMVKMRKLRREFIILVCYRRIRN